MNCPYCHNPLSIKPANFTHPCHTCKVRFAINQNEIQVVVCQTTFNNKHYSVHYHCDINKLLVWQNYASGPWRELFLSHFNPHQCHKLLTTLSNNPAFL